MQHSKVTAINTVNSQCYNFIPAVTDLVFHGRIHLSETYKNADQCIILQHQLTWAAIHYPLLATPFAKGSSIKDNCKKGVRES